MHSQELIIVGAGPAGMTAAVYAARKKLNALLLSYNIGGQVLWTSGVENYMGYQFIEGVELMRKFEEQVKEFPLEMRIGERVTALSRNENSFILTTDARENYESQAIIIATGKRPRQLNVPGEEKLQGRGVTYCAVCDGPLFAGESVAVIGGGNSALEAVDDMIKIAQHVYLVSLTPLTADPVLVDRVRKARNLTTFLEHEVTEIQGRDRVEEIRIRGLRSKQERELSVSGVFVEIGLIPNSDPFKGLVQLNHLGEIEINCANETNIPGVFAAGDVTNVPEKQIVVAAGEGAKAALQAHRYLRRLGI